MDILYQFLYNRKIVLIIFKKYNLKIYKIIIKNIIVILSIK
jgi:hypothetical protein